MVAVSVIVVAFVMHPLAGVAALAGLAWLLHTS
jgi:hypothetical protein